jgi:hypothetical protein
MRVKIERDFRIAYLIARDNEPDQTRRFGWCLLELNTIWVHTGVGIEFYVYLGIGKNIEIS